MNLVGDSSAKNQVRLSSPHEPLSLADTLIYMNDRLPSNAIVVRNGIKTYIRRDWAVIGANQALWQEIVDE